MRGARAHARAHARARARTTPLFATDYFVTWIPVDDTCEKRGITTGEALESQDATLYSFRVFRGSEFSGLRPTLQTLIRSSVRVTSGYIGIWEWQVGVYGYLGVAGAGTIGDEHLKSSSVLVCMVSGERQLWSPSGAAPGTKQKCARMRAHWRTRARVRACVRTCARTCVHTCARACARTRARACARACARGLDELTVNIQLTHS